MTKRIRALIRRRARQEKRSYRPPHSFDGLSMLAAFPGSRDLERRLHALFAHLRGRNEFFHFDFLIWNFLEIAKNS